MYPTACMHTHTHTTPHIHQHTATAQVNTLSTNSLSLHSTQHSSLPLHPMPHRQTRAHYYASPTQSHHHPLLAIPSAESCWYSGRTPSVAHRWLGETCGTSTYNDDAVRYIQRQGEKETIANYYTSKTELRTIWYVFRLPKHTKGFHWLLPRTSPPLHNIQRWKVEVTHTDHIPTARNSTLLVYTTKLTARYSWF